MGESGIIEIFMQEAREIIENLESDIVQLEEDSSDRETINRIFRYFHTLKGSSGIAGMTELYEFSHGLENLLDDVRSGNLEFDDRLVDLIFDSIDWIKSEIFADGGNDNPERKKSLQQRIAMFGEPSVLSPAPKQDDFPEREILPKDSAGYYRIKAIFRENIFEYGIDPLIFIQDLSNYGVIVKKKLLRTNMPLFENMNPEKCYTGWNIILKSTKGISEIEDVFLFVKDNNEIEIEDVTHEFRKNTENGGKASAKNLGGILLEKGILSEEELNEVIKTQELKKNRIGDILIEKGFATEKDVSEALDEQEKIKKRIEVSTVRVDTGRLDNLLNLLGEIVIGQSTLFRIADEMEDDTGNRLKNAVHALDRTTREFQEQIMSIRMIPVGPTFEQFRRFVRDASHTIGKKIKLAIEGGETELDKTMIERIGDPLKHMIRNSIDHGIESPEERENAGKDPVGNIILKAYHQEGNVFIEIIDDGQGINLEKVKQKAEAAGILKPDEEASKEKILSCLFAPGLSTADKIGNLSGRGVGMDVVKTNIEDLRGTVEILTEQGKGSTVRVKLPLTLAIIDGMLVNVGSYIYIVPLLSIIESVKPGQKDIKTIEGKGEVIQFRGEYVSLLRLHRMFGIEANYYNPWEGLVVIVESGSNRVGIMIDELIGQQQVVIKSLDNYITESRAISGAAILGDGKVALIIDIFGLINDTGAL